MCLLTECQSERLPDRLRALRSKIGMYPPPMGAFATFRISKLDPEARSGFPLRDSERNLS